MLKVPTTDIRIESPRQSEYVNIVSSEKENHYMLGHGSYGRVYKAIYRDQPVAVKIIRKVNDESVASVKRESNILDWNHENIIKILKVSSLDDCFTIIMERFPGSCLQTCLNEIMDQIPAWHRLRISMDIINGLRFCHAKHLVHLDVKPQNVFVAVVGDATEANYVCKLFDFGCSTFIDEKNCSTNQRGTIRYMSPEILQGFPIGLHDDIYSFGITMWQLKSNADPYHNIPSNEFVAYHVVKDNLRPDSKHFAKENENAKTMQLVGLNTNAFEGNERSACQLKAIKPSRRPLTPITPNDKRIPVEMEFQSTGHVRRHIKAKPSVSHNAVKKLDFNSMSTVDRVPFPSRAINKNLSMKELKLCASSEDTVDNNNVAAATLFKDSYQHLSIERRMEIENSYENIYKQCWGQEAAKRPSSQAILGLIQSAFHLFD
ncbi:hypothetical protein HA402_013399 [Bradysia odoriphaga]|nr:hypothetical protein HA402_012830 [Bradysia odoriphaga]KAG4069903.1 hypothetical protein HA402_013399 [Bradysia odoriphaga]